jgi:hypothetical protein
MAKIMARILSKHAASSRLEVIHYESARGFDEGHLSESRRFYQSQRL